MTLVFLDTETTGLDPLRHEVWEIAFAVNDGDIRSGIVPHLGGSADPQALAMNGYFDRARSALGPRLWLHDVEIELRAALAGATVVGSNPAFDTAFLRQRWGVAPWHYRLWDVSAYAAGVLGHEQPLGLHAITQELRELGYEIPDPDHSAAGDVATLRAAFRALQSIALLPFAKAQWHD